MVLKLASLNESHDEIETNVRLEAFVYIDNEGILDHVRYLFLLNHILYFLVIKDLILAHAFHCMVIFSLLVLNKEDFAEATLSNQFDYLIIIN